MSNMTEGNRLEENKKLSSQKQYLELLPQLREVVLREEKVFHLIKKLGRDAGFAKHEIRHDMMECFPSNEELDEQAEKIMSGIIDDINKEG